MRIVSLCPSITESLVALGLREQLVGVTRWCVHPAGELRGVCRVGGTKNPDAARIRELRPDLVFANAEENRREDVEELSRDLTVDLSHPRSPADVPALVRRFGERTDRVPEAEELAGRIERRMADAEGAGSFRYVVLIWKEPWMATAGRTYIDGLLAWAGGRNALARTDGPDYPAVSEEAVVASAPDVLVLPDEPYRFGEPNRAFWRARLPESEVRCVAGDDLCWHGVRTLRGLELVDDLVRSLPAGRLA